MGWDLLTDLRPHLKSEMWGTRAFSTRGGELWRSYAWNGRAFHGWGTRIVLGTAIGFLGAGSACGQAPTKPAASESQSDALTRADASFRAGYAAMQGGRLEEARRDFAETVRLAPGVAEARVALGAILVELGRPEEAVPELERALALKPDEGTRTNLALAHEAVARKMLGAGKLPEAETELEAAIGQVSSSEQALQSQAALDQLAVFKDELGSLLAQEKRWVEAEREFEEVLSETPEASVAPQVHMHLGVVLIEEKHYAEALGELGKAVEAEPKNALAQFELGRGLAGAGRDEEAVAHFEEALKLNAAMPGGALELAMADQRLGKQEESIPWFEKAVDQEPRNSIALANLGLALTQTGKAKEAVPYIERALVETPKDAVVLEDMGVAELQQSHFDEAIVQFKRALEVDGQSAQLHYDLGLAYKLKDETGEAIAELEKAAALDGSLPDPPYTLGILYMQMGKQAEAVNQLRAALVLRPGNGDGWAILGSELKQMGQQAEAEQALRKAVELEPGQPGAHITLASLLAEEGKTADAAAERKIAAGLSRTAVNRQRAVFNTNAGNQLLLRGEVADAVSKYQDAIAADPGYVEAHAQLAVAYERQGRASEAKAEREKAAGLGK